MLPQPYFYLISAMQQLPAIQLLCFFASSYMTYLSLFQFLKRLCMGKAIVSP